MPKKAKKGRGGKGGGQTEEQRLVYLQRRAQAEEETVRKKEEVLTLFLKDKLQKEENNTAVNLLKLNNGWRSILRQTRAAELHQDITVVSQTFERHLDSLDSVIKNLERDLQEAERQSAQVRRVHLQNLERLRTQQDKRLKVLQRQWEAGLQHLTSRFSCERKQMSADSEQQRDLEDAEFSVELQHKTVMNETQRLYDDIVMSYQGTRQYWTSNLTLKSKEKTLEKQEDEKLCNEEVKTLDQLLAKNKQLVERTHAEMKCAKGLQDAVIHLRHKLNSDNTKKQSVVQDLTVDGNLVKQKTCELREQLSWARTAARKQLTDLTVQSDQAAKKLQAAIDKGETILSVAEMCHKLESEQQNISSTLSQTEEGRLERTGHKTEKPAEEVFEFPEPQQLIRSVNAAVLQREALKKHKDDMSRENQQLRLLLRQHLDAMTVTDSAFNGQHALLAVHPAPTTATPVASNRWHNVIEAAHTSKHSLKE